MCAHSFAPTNYAIFLTPKIYHAASRSLARGPTPVPVGGTAHLISHRNAIQFH
jgi:hypothetical protein